MSVAQAGQQPLVVDRIGPAWRGRAGGLKSAFDVAGAFAAFVLLAEKGGIRMKQGTGALWRIRRLPGSAPGDLPSPPRELPFYPIQAAVVIGAVVAVGAGLVALLRRVFRRR